MGLIDEVGSGPVALDTVAFIYLIEEHPDYLPLLLPILERVASGSLGVVTSAVTILEVLVVPYRAGDLMLADRYEELLTRSRGVTVVDASIEQLKAAAQLRAVHGLRTPDALQVAAALSMECTALVTNDRRLPEIGGLKIVQLAGLVERPR